MRQWAIDLVCVLVCLVAFGLVWVAAWGVDVASQAVCK